MGLSWSRFRFFIREEETVDLTAGSDSSSGSTPSNNSAVQMGSSNGNAELHRIVREYTGDGCPIKKLPQDLLLKIFSHLDVVSKCRCARVCREWHLLALDGSNWQDVDLFDFQTAIEGTVVVQLSRRCGGFLRQLSLNECRSVEDPALATFARNCKNIERLCLRNCLAITDRTPESISRYCSNLKVLDLSSCKNITNLSCGYLSRGCKHLERIELSYCTKVTHEGIATLMEGCRNLKIIDLNYCPEINDSAVRSIGSNCKELERLLIRSCKQVTDASLQVVSEKCPNLRRLDVAGCDLLTDTTLRSLGSHCSQLRILEAAECTQFSDAGFKALAEGCNQLEKLDLEECIIITDTTLFYLSQHCPSLQSLILSHCERITDEGVRNLVTGASVVEGLQELEIDNCPNISDVTLDVVSRHCPDLKRLEVFDCQHVSRSGIEKLKALRQDLRIQAYFAPSNPQPTGSNQSHRTITCRCCVII